MDMKMKCSVIQDLLPSYVDNICSEDTKELVREHVAECEQCRKKLEKMKNTEIVAGKASKKQVDYLKKIRGTFLQKEVLGKVTLVILLGIAFVGLFTGGGGLLDYPRIPSVLFSILIFCAAALAGNYQYSGGKAAAVEIAVSGAALVLAVSSFQYLVWGVVEYLVENNPNLFPFDRMEMVRIGPLYANTLRILTLIPVAVLLWNTFGKRKNGYATTLNITAISYIVYANDWLYHMDGPDASLLWARELTISQIVLTAVGIITYALLRKFR